MIKYIVIIGLIFLVLILGQQTFFKDIGREYIGRVQQWGSGLWQSAQDYWSTHILKKVTSEVEKRQNIAKDEIKDQAKQVTQTVWQKIKGYFVGIFNSVFNKGSTEPDTTQPAAQ